MKIYSTCLTACIFTCGSNLSFAQTKLMIMIYFLGLSQTSWTNNPLFLHNPCSTLPWFSLPATPPFPLPPNCFPPALTGLSLSPTPNNYARVRLLLRIHIRVKFRLNTWLFESVKWGNLSFTLSMSREIYRHKYQYHLHWFEINLISSLPLGFSFLVCRIADCEMRR